MRWIFYRIVPRRISFRHARSNLVIDTWVKTVAKLVENITPDGFNAQRMVLFSVQTRYDYAFFRCNTLSLPSEQETRLEKKFRSTFARWMNFPLSIIFFPLFFFFFSFIFHHFIDTQSDSFRNLFAITRTWTQIKYHRLLIGYSSFWSRRKKNCTILNENVEIGCKWEMFTQYRK